MLAALAVFVSIGDGFGAAVILLWIAGYLVTARLPTIARLLSSFAAALVVGAGLAFLFTPQALRPWNRASAEVGLPELLAAPGYIVLIIVAAVTYFSPTIVAVRREKKNLASIGLVNLFFGWTLIGWVVALAWAVSVQVVDSPSVATSVPLVSAPILCTHCGKYSEPSARFCANCGVAFTTSAN